MINHRLLICFLAVLALPACSTTPERYAFWRDVKGEEQGKPPNLGDVPAASDTQTAKAEMESMRARLEIERQNTFRAAEGLAPLPLPENAEMMPQTLAQFQPVPQQASQEQVSTAANGAVQYNFMPQTKDQPYLYGNSNVQIKQTLDQQMVQQNVAFAPQSPKMISTDTNIQIDMSALGNDPADVFTGAPQKIDMVNDYSYASTHFKNAETVAFFNHGSSTIDSQSKEKVTALVDKIQHSNKPVTLVGYASTRTGLKDSLSAKVVNLRMSAKRAETVMKELSQRGVSADKIKITASGDSKAGVQEDADRRVDVLFDE